MTTAIKTASEIRKGRARNVAIGVGVAALLGVTVGLSTGASFTSTVTAPDTQQVGVGFMELDAETEAESEPIDATLLPGDSVSTVIDVWNTGAAAYWTLDIDQASASPELASVLEVTVSVQGANSVTRTLEEWQSGLLQVSQIIPDMATQVVTITAELPIDAGNDTQDTAASFTLRADAIQAKNNTQPTAGWVAD